MQLRNLHPIKVLIISVFFVSACHTAKPVLTAVTIPEPAIEHVEPEQKEDKFFAALFENQGGIIDSIRQHRKDWNVQIIYTEVNRSRNGCLLYTSRCV